MATGIAIRSDIPYRRKDDFENLGISDGFQRWGTDISATLGGYSFRVLSVHLKSGCWGVRQDGDERRKGTCSVLRSQLAQLRIWAGERSREGLPFVILGDFNRRLAVEGDWGWEQLSSGLPQLRLLTHDVPAACDPRYPDFIDHIIVGGGAEELLAEEPFREFLQSGPTPITAHHLQTFGPKADSRPISTCHNRTAENSWH